MKVQRNDWPSPAPNPSFFGLGSELTSRARGDRHNVGEAQGAAGERGSR